MGFKLNACRPKPAMKVKEQLESLLESRAKGPEFLLGNSYEIVTVGIIDIDPGSYQGQCTV